ncbi:hypothetical protein [Actinoallomurus sp. CA-150999]|uniref:hypothetical protein n=1 Tax=Actinoallomurus sp. CA-150999 TaxID=3239887 RepID=UPI003D8D08E8
MIRADLLALTPDALAALANRGLVKRATKELDAGNAPAVDVAPDGTVRGRFPDGAEATLPDGGGLEGASCTCAATGVCRHRIGLILAYQRQAAEMGRAADAESPARGEADAAQAGTAHAGTAPGKGTIAGGERNAPDLPAGEADASGARVAEAGEGTSPTAPVGGAGAAGHPAETTGDGVESALADSPDPHDPVDRQDMPALADPADRPTLADRPDPANLPALADRPDPANLPALADPPDPADLPALAHRPDAADLPVLADRPDSADRPNLPDAAGPVDPHGVAGSADPGGAAGPPGNVGRPPWSLWSPGAFDDEALVRTLGQRALTAARRTHRAGYSARIRRPTPADPVAAVELSTCTVRFLVPGELGYVHTDAATGLRGEVITLAVWAFRAADERGLRGEDVRVDVGGRAGGGPARSGLEAVVGLVDEVLLEGAVHAGPLQPAALRRASRALTARNLHWPASALDDLTEQLAAYQDRAARYAPETLAGLLAEVHARHRAARHSDGLPRAQVLGTDESAETPLRQVRLTALGCRVGGTEDERTADVFLAQAHSGVVLVLKRRWEVAEGQALTGGDLASRRILGSTLRSLAAANVVSENASRSAGRVVRLAAGRVSRTTVTPVGVSWKDLPGSVLVRDLRALDREVASLPPALIRPRVEAELIRVVEAVEVHEVGYDPGGQRLEAVIADANGTTAVVSAVYSPYRPGALDSLAEVLTEQATGPLLISGAVRRTGGALVLDPIAVMAGGAVIVPDLAPGAGGAALDPYAGRQADPLGAALGDAVAACAEAAHRGLRHATDGVRTRVEKAAHGLRRVGLRTAADLVAGLGTALRSEDADRMTSAWIDAWIRLATLVELR